MWFPDHSFYDIPVSSLQREASQIVSVLDLRLPYTNGSNGMNF